MNIIEFLEARIAEDESLAEAAIKSHAPDEVWESELGSMNLWPEDIAFWASQTPYRVLAECAAKRAIIKSLASTAAAHSAETRIDQKLVLAGMDTGLRLALTSLTAPYSDHPDYQQEWA